MSTYGYDMPGGRAPEGQPPVPTPGGPSPAGQPQAGDPTAVMGRRTGAWAVDALLFGVLYFLFSLIGPFAKYEKIPESMSHAEACEQIEDEVTNVTCVTLSGDLPLIAEDRAYYLKYEIALLGLLATVAWFVLIYVVWQGATGATPGKALFRVRVVDDTGAPPGMGRSFVRSLLWVVDGMPCIPLVGFVTGLTSSGHRRVGDMAAHTLVVDAAAAGRPVNLPIPGAPAPGPPPAPVTGQGPMSPPIAGQAPMAPPVSGQVPVVPHVPHVGQPQGPPLAPPTALQGPPQATPVTAPVSEPPAGDAAPAPTEEQAPAETRPAPPTAGEPETGAEQPAASTPTEVEGGTEEDAEAEVETTVVASPEEVPPTSEPESQPATSPQVEEPAQPEEQPAATATPAAEPAPQPTAGQAQPAAQTYKPQWDADRGAYIQWEPNRSRWLQWDDDAKEWKPI